MHNGTLFSHKKEYIGISSNEVHELKSLLYRVKQFRKRKQILYINAYKQNLEKWYS